MTDTDKLTEILVKIANLYAPVCPSDKLTIEEAHPIILDWAKSLTLAESKPMGGEYNNGYSAGWNAYGREMNANIEKLRKP